jgi:hypothetical protein
VPTRPPALVPIGPSKNELAMQAQIEILLAAQKRADLEKEIRTRTEKEREAQSRMNEHITLMTKNAVASAMAALPAQPSQRGQFLYNTGTGTPMLKYNAGEPEAPAGNE